MESQFISELPLGLIYPVCPHLLGLRGAPAAEFNPDPTPTRMKNTPPPTGLFLGRLLGSLALAIGLALPLTAMAQAGSGSITGRVLNVGNGKYVGNAVVTIEGTKHETLTNDYGEYRLNDVAPGEVKLHVASTGLDPESATVTVAAGTAVNIIPSTTVNEDNIDPVNNPGTLTTRNTGLKPWVANNYDLSVEYYFKKSGFVSAGVFEKTITNFFETRGGTVDAALAQQLGIGPEFIGWGVSTTVNGTGTAKIRGYEVNASRQLDFLPGYLRYLSVNTNGTLLELSGASANAFNLFIKKTANFGLSWNKKPLSAQVNINYRGRELNSAQTGAQYGATNGFNEYYAPRAFVDVNAEYTISKRFKFFANARNIFNKQQVLQRYADGSASYGVNYRREEFGIQIAAGIKGTF